MAPLHASSVGKETRTLSSWYEVFFLDTDTMAALTQSNKTVSKDVKGKYEQLRTRNGVAGGGSGSRVGERTGFLARWTFWPA